MPSNRFRRRFQIAPSRPTGAIVRGEPSTIGGARLARLGANRAEFPTTQGRLPGATGSATPEVPEQWPTRSPVFRFGLLFPPPRDVAGSMCVGRTREQPCHSARLAPRAPGRVARALACASFVRRAVSVGAAVGVRPPTRTPPGLRFGASSPSAPCAGLGSPCPETRLSFVSAPLTLVGFGGHSAPASCFLALPFALL